MSLLDNSTGELIVLPSNEFELYKKTQTNTSTINSQKYIIVDSIELELLYRKSSNPNQLKNEIGLLISLAPRIQFKSNVLLAANEEPLTADSIAEYFNLSRKTVKSTLNTLVQHGVIFYGKIESINLKKKAYFVNPYLFRMGKDFYNAVLLKFNNQVDANNCIEKARLDKEKINHWEN